MCPACGYPDLEEPPVDDRGVGSFEICSSCWFEFGHTYEATRDYARWRRQWIAEGMPWRSGEVEPPPQDWNPAEQLRNVPDSD